MSEVVRVRISTGQYKATLKQEKKIDVFVYLMVAVLAWSRYFELLYFKQYKLVTKWNAIWPDPVGEGGGGGGGSAI